MSQHSLGFKTQFQCSFDECTHSRKLRCTVNVAVHPSVSNGKELKRHYLFQYCQKSTTEDSKEKSFNKKEFINNLFK